MRILITTNGPSHTEAALRLGAQVARRVREPPTVLTVIGHEADGPPASIETILARARELLGSEVPKLQTKVRIGCPAEEIIREAKEGNYDLVIVGERPDRSLLGRLFRGPIAVRVVKHAPCSVIVVKGKAGPIRRILVCDSGVASPSIPSRLTALLGDLLEGEEVTVLHVMSQMSAGPGVRGKHLRAGVKELVEERTPEGELLERDIEALERSGVSVQAKVLHGMVVDEILAEAQSGDYDLVVIGAYRGEGWQHVLLDDLAHKIVAKLDRPVLVMR